MNDEVIVVRDMRGQYSIAVREPEHFQYPSITPPRYVVKASVWDANDIADVAQAFGWIPRHEPACPECGREMESYDLRNGLDDVVSSHAYCRNCGYTEEDDE